jgi:hypothetical protein
LLKAWNDIASPGKNYGLRPGEMNLIFNAMTIPSAPLYAALNEQDFLPGLRRLCAAAPLGREVDYMIGSRGPLDRKLFRYATMPN